MTLKKQKINIKNVFRKTNISEAVYFKQSDVSTILWPIQLVLDVKFLDSQKLHFVKSLGEERGGFPG